MRTGQRYYGIWLAFVVFLVFGLSGSARAADTPYRNIGHGQLTAQFLSVGQLQQPGPTIQFASCPLPGDWRTEISTYWGNIWNYDAKGNHYLIDGEWLHTCLSLSRRWHKRWSIGARLLFIGRTGGFADSMIEDFHDTFGFDNFHRKEFPRNRALIEYDDNRGRRRQIAGDNWGLGDLSFFVSWWATPGTRRIPSVDLYAMLALPTGDPDQLRGLGAAQIGGGFRLSKRLWNEDWYGYLILQGLYCFTDELGGIDLYRFRAAGIGALEYAFNERVSVVGQTAISTPAARHFYDFSDPVYEASLGLKYLTGKQSRVEISLVENLFNFDNSVDFGLHLAWTRGF